LNKKNTVVFKGRKDGILVMLDKDCDFDELKSELEKKAVETANFFGDVSTALFFSGRELNEREEIELIEIFFRVTKVDVTYVTSKGNEIVRKAEKPKNKKAENERPVKREVVEEFSASENPTYYYSGSLRSGQSIHYAGSVVLFGDLHSGSEITAEGHIIVIGAIKGLVHAGCSGNADCFVFSLNLQPTQLRIAGIIAYMPREPINFKDKSKAGVKPFFAYVENEKIIFETPEKFRIKLPFSTKNV